MTTVNLSKIRINQKINPIWYNFLFFVFIFIIAVLLVFQLRSSQDDFGFELYGTMGYKFEDVELFSYFFKVVSIGWLIMVPLRDYLNWSLKKESKERQSILFLSYQFLAILLFTFLISTAFLSEAYTYIQKNWFFYSCLLVSLHVLYFADKAVISHVKSEAVHHENELNEYNLYFEELKKTNIVKQK